MNYSNYLKKFNLNSGISNKELFKLKLPNEIPSEYIEFLKVWNGGEGLIGEEYIILYKAEELKQINKDYEVEEYVKGIFLFGSNGGGEALAFDLRKQNSVSYILIPFLFDYDDIIIISKNLSDFFKRIYKKGFFN